MTDVQNGPSINLRTVVHLRRLTLRIFLEISENRFSKRNKRHAERSVVQSMDLVHFYRFRVQQS